MAVSIVEGTIDSLELRQARKKFSLYKHVTIRGSDGNTTRVEKAVAAAPIAERLAPGVAGKFYLFRTIDVRGVHGIRLNDGTAIQQYPGANHWIFAILIVVNLLWALLLVALEGRVPFLAVPLILLGVVGYVLTSNAMRDAKSSFEAG